MASARRKSTPDCRRYSNPKNRRQSVYSSNMASSQIKQVILEDDYTVIKQLGTGRYSVVKLAEHRTSKKVIALKMFAKGIVRQADFLREYNYSFFLSPHQNVVDTYEGAFSTDDAFFFAQEFCPTKSLREIIESTNGGVPEDSLKKILFHVLAAFEFLHSEQLVHRNFKAENILVFDPKEYSRVKITDFGLTRKEDTVVKHVDKNNAYHAPELCETLQKETYVISYSVDVWALGIVIFYALRKYFPWERAHITCAPYFAWEQWVKRKSPQTPKQFTARCTERGLKLFRKTLAPRAADRTSIKGIKKYMKDRWMKEMIRSISEDDLQESDNLRERTASDSIPRAVSQGQMFRNRSPGLQEDHATTNNNHLAPPAVQKKRGFLSNFVASTISAMSEISEQVVSANPD